MNFHLFKSVLISVNIIDFPSNVYLNIITVFKNFPKMRQDAAKGGLFHLRFLVYNSNKDTYIIKV
ncbi:hypothetical protein DCC85_18180 [Paenibacillus sp. CAA11]|nr:hypothetical protein DCC85_18180 [Paenibacillus sp. CAA11]